MAAKNSLAVIENCEDGGLKAAYQHGPRVQSTRDDQVSSQLVSSISLTSLLLKTQEV